MERFQVGRRVHLSSLSLRLLDVQRCQRAVGDLSLESEGEVSCRDINVELAGM